MGKLKNDILWELDKIPGFLNVEMSVRSKMNASDNKKEKSKVSSGDKNDLLNIKNVKKEEKAEIKRALKIIEIDEYSDIGKTIAAKAGDNEFLKYMLIMKSTATAKWTQYGLYYLTEPTAKLISNIDNEIKSFLNGIAEHFGFNKMYPSVKTANLENYDYQFDSFESGAEFFLSIDDLDKNAKKYLAKMEERKKQLGIVNKEEVCSDRKSEDEKGAEGEKLEPEFCNYGAKGEAEVEYTLKWLPQEDYIVVKRSEESGIVVRCNDVSDEKQEIDHIVIGPQGVFLIETKNYNGKITIDEQGNWIREKRDGTVVGERNPIQQVDRHHMVIEKMLGITDIYDIVCIAHEKAIIEGVDNSAVKVVKVDMLGRYIKEFKNTSRTYTTEERCELRQKIEAYRVDR